MKKGFFAYSSRPESCGFAIENAIKEINKSEDYNICSWTAMNKYGRILIDEILLEIDNSDFFCADLTGVNDNVLFELGYAISKDKPLFIIFDTSIIDSTRRFHELGLLTTIGYQSYQNSSNIVKSFYDFASKNLIGSFDSLVKLYAKNSERKALLYIKSKYTTESSRQIPSIIDEYKIPVIIDDAFETKVQPISWYIEQLSNVHAIICEFLPTSRIGFELQNSKSAFISGLSYGLNLDTLIICEEPYETPIDYRDLLKKYNSPSKCKNIVLPFVQGLYENIAKILTTKNNLSKKVKNRSEFQNINFGDCIAENEKDELSDYFIETYLSNELIRKDLNIVVGRKGAGKSATFLYLKETLSYDKRNIVCLITPIDFEIDGLVSLIEDISDEFEKNYLVEAIWKFLVTTEIAKNIYEKTKNKPVYSITSFETQFIEFIEKNKELYIDDISTRLENRIQQIKENSSIKLKQSEFKNKITESLHLETIYALKQHFANIIESNKKIIVLIDNLDKSWRKDDKVATVSRIILGLVSSADRIVGDISIIKQKHTKLNFNLTIFLRSDIYKNIIQYAREPDKINPIWLKWNDYEVFFRIIEERFSVLNNKESAELWTKYATHDVDGEELREYIIKRILPRPRDIIYFFQRAQATAIARGHSMMNSDDFKNAYSEYSVWVFNSLKVENGITIKQMEDFMYGLSDSCKIISLTKLTEILNTAKIDIPSPDYLEYFIDHLISLSILGREIRLNEFEFEYEFNFEKKNKILSMRLENRRFEIHKALHPYLGIK
jgi:hypothetical protein